MSRLEFDDRDDDRQKYRITVRFGVELLEDGHTAVPNLVLNHYAKLGISPAEMMFTIHIWQYWWTEKQPYPSLQAVADKMQVSRRQVRNYAQSLKEKQLLEVHERYAPGLGQTTSEYDFTRFFQRILELAKRPADTPRKNLSEGGRKEISQAPRNDISSEEYERKSYPVEEDEELISKERNSNLFLSKPQNGGESTAVRSQRIVDNPPRYIPSTRHTISPATPTGWAAVGGVLAERRSRAPAPTDRAPSGRGRPPKAPPYLAATIEEITLRLNDDPSHVRSNTTRATKLWKYSGLPEDKFVTSVLYQARSLAQQQGHVTKRAAAGAGGPINRVPYFFAVVEDLLGLKDRAGDPL
jgi:hypothetical protein